MPTRTRSLSSRQPQTRGRWVRSNGNITVNGAPDGLAMDGNGPVWWYGLDSGGGATPIGPNGPFTTTGPAQAVVTRATSLICGPLSAAPFRVLDQVTIGNPSPTPRWLTDPMLLRPDARFTDGIYPDVLMLARSEFWASWVRSALWYGIGAFVCTSDDTGQPLAGTLRLIDPLLLSTERDEQGSLRWVLGADSDDSARAVFGRDGTISLGPITYRLITMRNPLSPVDSEGYSQGVFAMSPTAFQLAGQIDTYSQGTFRSGIPAGYLQVETPGLGQPQAEELKARWMAAHGSDRRSIAVLNATTSFHALNLSPVDAALGETKRLNIADVAFAFGLDPLTLGVSLANSATYNNLRDAWINHRDFGLAPWIAAIQDVLTSLLAGTSGVVVNLDGFANPPLKERVETGAKAVDAGLMTINEWRALEGLEPLPEPEPAPVPPELAASPATEQPPEPAPEQRRRPAALTR